MGMTKILREIYERFIEVYEKTWEYQITSQQGNTTYITTYIFKLKFVLITAIWACAILNTAYMISFSHAYSNKIFSLNSQMEKSKYDLYKAYEDYDKAIKTFDETFDKTFQQQ